MPVVSQPPSTTRTSRTSTPPASCRWSINFHLQHRTLRPSTPPASRRWSFNFHLTYSTRSPWQSQPNISSSVQEFLDLCGSVLTDSSSVIRRFPNIPGVGVLQNTVKVFIHPELSVIHDHASVIFNADRWYSFKSYVDMIGKKAHALNKKVMLHANLANVIKQLWRNCFIENGFSFLGRKHQVVVQY